MFGIVNDTYSSCQYLFLIISMVRYNSFISRNVSLWVILDVNPFHRFGLIPPGFYFLILSYTKLASS